MWYQYIKSAQINPLPPVPQSTGISMDTLQQLIKNASDPKNGPLYFREEYLAALKELAGLKQSKPV